MHDPVRRLGHPLHLQLQHPALQPVQQFGQQGLVFLAPEHRGGHARCHGFVRQVQLMQRVVCAARRAQRRGTVVIQRACQAATLVRPCLAVLLTKLRRQPCAALQKRPEATESVVGQQDFSIGPAEKVHVRAGRLLRRVVPQFAQKGGGVRGIDDEQVAQQVRPLRRQVPGQRTAPVMRHQQVQRCAECFDGRHDVAHHVLGAVGRDFDRGGRTDEAAQVGCHASGARCHALHHLVPDKCSFRKAVQQHRPHGPDSCRAAGQRDAV